ncbi:MAG: YrbL family protein [Pseudoruegeria sp.]
MNRSIWLNPDEILAQGSGRVIYQHPEEAGALVKVFKPRTKPLGLSYKCRPIKRRFLTLKTAYLEYEEYISALARLNEMPSYLPSMMGFVNTNLGLAMVVERVDGPDGNLAPSLHKYLLNEGLSPSLVSQVNSLVDQLKKHRIVVFDLTARNIVVGACPENGTKLMVVDGLSENTFIRLKSYSRWAFETWLEKKRTILLEDMKVIAAGKSSYTLR